MDCGSWCVVGETESGSKVVIPLSCRSWSCTSCAKRNRQKLMTRLKDVPATTLLTLTCNPKRHPDVNEAFKRTSLAVNQLFKRIRRRWPHARVEYLLVWERTKKGWPHAHLLLQAPYIPQTWLSNVWDELTGAPIVDIRAITGQAQIVSYIAKYLSKDPQAPDGMKRYRCSRLFFGQKVAVAPGKTDDVTHWRVVHATAAEVARNAVYDGYTAQESPDGSYVCIDPRRAQLRLPTPSLTDYRLIASPR